MLPFGYGVSENYYQLNFAADHSVGGKALEISKKFVLRGGPDAQSVASDPLRPPELPPHRQHNLPWYGEWFSIYSKGTGLQSFHSCKKISFVSKSQFRERRAQFLPHH